MGVLRRVERVCSAWWIVMDASLGTILNSCARLSRIDNRLRGPRRTPWVPARVFIAMLGTDNGTAAGRE